MILYRPLAYLLIAVLGALALLCLFIWRKQIGASRHPSGPDDDPTTWLLVGLMIVASFSLGALVMYVVWFGR